MAEGLLRHQLGAAGLPIDVSSAGFLFDGEPATDDAVATLNGYGIDISGHRSRIVTPDLAGGADLIVTMTAHHVAELAGVAPADWRRAFPLRELARRAQDRPAVTDLRGWVAALGEDRTPRDVLSAVGDDIDDPFGRPRACYERTAAELDGLLAKLVQAVSGSGASGSIP